MTFSLIIDAKNDYCPYANCRLPIRLELKMKGLGVFPKKILLNTTKPLLD
jgi:hypothetical protein